MATKKSDRRKLAESIARQKGIAVKSAMRYLQRAAAPEGKQRIKTPRYSGLSDTLRKRAKRTITRERKARRVTRADVSFPEILPGKRRVNYQSSDTRVVGVKATYNFYGSDRRHRQIRLEMDGDELNEFLNAPNETRALEVLTRLRNEAFLAQADVSNLEFFTIEGKMHKGDYWQ